MAEYTPLLHLTFLSVSSKAVDPEPSKRLCSAANKVSPVICGVWWHFHMAEWSSRLGGGALTCPAIDSVYHILCSLRYQLIVKRMKV